MSDGSLQGLAGAERETLGSATSPGRYEGSAPSIPAYLRDTYSWAYLHPRSIWLFEREWVVNLILWGNMRRLTQAVLDEIDPEAQGSTLQVACVYGAFSKRLAHHLQGAESDLHIVDVAPIQIRNVRSKLAGERNVHFHVQDSSALRFRDGQFSTTVVFFLLHEQPATVRSETIAEAIRVTRPGGKVIFVDYHAPSRWNPLRYLMRPVLRTLEPFALDLWRNPLQGMLPPGGRPVRADHRLFGGGLYQRLVLELSE